MLAVIGFCVVIWQIQQAKSLAKAASDASNATAERIREMLTVSDLMQVIGELRGIQDNLRHSQLHMSCHRLQQVRIHLSGLKNRKGFLDEIRRAEIQAIIAQLAKLQTSLERVIENSKGALSIAKASDGLASCIDTLAEWAEERRSEGRR